MKKISLLLVLVVLLGHFMGLGQDVSNKGKDFWLGYGYHHGMVTSTGTPITSGGSQDLVLYFTSDKNANVLVEIPALNYSQNYLVIKNQITVSNPLPKSGIQDSRIIDTGYFNRGIHISSDESVVAYAHIYSQNVSGASLLFPTNTLGKEYYSINFTQATNNYYGYSNFFVIATEDNTTVEITPSADNKNNKPIGVPFFVTLNKGQIYSVFGTNTNYQITGNPSGQFSYGSDLTGSKIRSVSNNSSGSCKKIAVFSGTGKMSIGGAARPTGSGDNFIAQAFPSVAWGQKYLTVPTGTQPNNFYRVCVKDSNTVVKLNGKVLLRSTLINGFYYQFKNGNEIGSNPPTQNLIEADQPIIVAQYTTSQNQEGNPNTNPGGDPEMIYLSPVEQTINNITLYSASRFNILQSYINVIIKNGGVASFTLDGVSKSTNFLPHPQESNYSYAVLPVTAGSHTLFSDTGFNAIAYGFGNAESYGYNAGTNIRDFTPVATFQNPLARVDSAVTCINTPLKFSVPLSVVPSTIRWDFTAAPNILPNNNIGPLTTFSADSVKTLNGIVLNYYSAGYTYTFSKSNTTTLRDTIKIYTTSATPDGCGSTDQVFTIPVIVREGLATPSFSISHFGCVTDSARITDQTPNANGLITRWFWDFGDGTNADLNSSLVPSKLYPAIGNYSVKLKLSNDIGCASDSSIQVVNISSKPVASFTKPAIACVNDTVTFTDGSTIQTGAIAKWVWNLDKEDGKVDTISTNLPQAFKYSTYGIKDVRLVVQSSTGCNSDTFRLAAPFKVSAIPEPGFVIPEVCLNDASALFTDTTKIADGSAMTYLWNFNAGTPLVAPGPTFTTAATTTASPLVKYNKAADYKVSLTVTANGCVASLSKDFTVNGANPTALFEVQKPTGLCSNDSVRIKNKSTVDFGLVTRLEIFWDANDLTRKTTDENPNIDKLYAYKYPDFQFPLTKTYTVTLRAYSGNAASCSKSVTQVITVNASPKVSFLTMPGICLEATARQITQTSFDNRVPGSFTYTGSGVSTTGLFNPVSAGVGVFPILYKYTSDKACVDTATKNMTVWPTPVAVWNVIGNTCEKNTILFTDSSLAKYSNITERIWNYDDGTASLTKTSDSSYTRIFANAKTYTISLQVKTDSGCISTLNTQPIKVNHLPKPAFSLPSICLPDGRGQFLNQSTIGDGSELLFSYLWAFNDPNDASSSTLKEPTHRYTALGPYPVKLQITSKDGCIDSLVQSLTTVYPQPKASFSTMPQVICINDTIQFNDLGNGMSSNAQRWVWDLANGNSSTLQNPLKKFVDSGSFTVGYHFFNAQGCVSDTVSKQITVYPYPKLVIGPTIKILEGGETIIKPKLAYGTGLTYQWLPSLYLSSDTAATPKTTPLDDITYTLVLTGTPGCSVSDTIFIQVLKSPEVPNAFSPNGDGINDTWRIKYLESYPGAEIEVFNRYGQKVFHSIGYDTDWDGNYNGKGLPVGTYYYVINPKNGRQIVKGSVTLIK